MAGKKNFLKKIESWNKKITYSIFRWFFRNKPAEIPLDVSKIKKILIFRYDAIGDMIVTTPVIKLLHQMIPGVEIHLLGSPKNEILVKHNKYISKIFIHDGSFSSFIKNIFAARKEKYDLVLAYVLFRTTYAGTLANLIGGRHAIKATILHPERKKLYSTFFNIQLPAERDKYTMVELQAILLCGIFGWKYSIDELDMEIYINPEARLTVDKYIEKLPKKEFVLLNISAGREFRRWSVGKNREFMNAVHKFEPDIQFVILTDPQNIKDAESIAEGMDERVSIFPPTKNFLEVCSLVERALIAVTPDTSIVHIASAVKVPVLAFYSYQTNYVMEWMPFRVPFRALITENKLPIETLSIDDVLSKFKELYIQVKEKEKL